MEVLYTLLCWDEDFSGTIQHFQPNKHLSNICGALIKHIGLKLYIQRLVCMLYYHLN